MRLNCDTCQVATACRQAIRRKTAIPCEDRPPAKVAQPVYGTGRYSTRLQTQRRILEVLRDSGALTMEELAAEVKVSKKSAIQYLKGAERNGRVTRLPDGETWQLAGQP